MTSIIRPTLILKMSLDQHVCSPDHTDGIKRAYSYIAPVLVQELPECAAGSAHNNLRFTIKLRNPYWDANDADCREQWDAVMPKWLHNMLYKVFSTVGAANKQFAEHGQLTMPYRWLELDFEDNALIRVKTDAESQVDADAVVEMVEQVRRLYAQGVLDSTVSCVSIPSAASYEAQLEQARAEAAAADAAEDEGGDAAEEADGQDAQGAEEPAAQEQEADAGADEGEGAEAEEAEPAFAWPEEPAFKIDMGTWGVEYADGGVRELDSASSSFKE